LKILIVDDSPLIHSLLRKTLEKNGHEVCGDAKNGKEAVELFQKLNPEVIFMDITMPIMDGMEASKNIKTINPKANIIMLSAMGDEEIREEAKNLGIDIFLKKPFNDYMIISAISKVVV
jgi:two-component system chemotaxis response regulator CheY